MHLVSLETEFIYLKLTEKVNYSLNSLVTFQITSYNLIVIFVKISFSKNELCLFLYHFTICMDLTSQSASGHQYFQIFILPNNSSSVIPNSVNNHLVVQLAFTFSLMSSLRLQRNVIYLFLVKQLPL